MNIFGAVFIINTPDFKTLDCDDGKATI